MLSAAAVMAPVAARSSLEVMLDTIREREEQPKDLPPALPARPTSRGRLPTARRTLPSGPKLANGSAKGAVSESPAADEKVDAGKGSSREAEEVVFKSGIFGCKRMYAEMEGPEESPYAKAARSENCREERRQDAVAEEAPSVAPPSAVKIDLTVGCGETVEHVLRKKLRVWCCVPDAKWELGQIKSISGDDAEILLANGKVLTVSLESLLPANPTVLDGVDDLIQLSYLNEPSVLYNLQYRYSRDLVYTKAGPILIAVNPFKEVALYGKDIIMRYRQQLENNPHVYAVADSAFNEMQRVGVNQSIIISGESGAGKTETAKIAMQYLAALAGGNGIESEVLQTNVILEAFGNAKTSRNDNSSRFGKLIEIQFSGTGKICGAKIQAFLLEKSRVVQRAAGERSYHVFYQLCSGAPRLLRDQLFLKEAQDYEYLKHSGRLRIDGIDDAKRFLMLMAALDILQISKEDQMKMFSMLVAVLWLGNIAFSVIDNENHVEVLSNEALATAAKLLGCNVAELMLALSTRKIQAGNDSVVQKLTLAQAIDARDALAKSIYANLFDWIVEQINKSLEAGKQHSGRSISILDIYGFESFHKNGFEQFCINYANERLQQHFNRHLFKLEQEEYIEDGIDWANVDFVDNTDCLNLFEKKPLGLLSVLDEESTFPRATDLTFSDKLKQHLSGNVCFKADREGSFRICHYAGEVIYDTSGFLEKNRDPLHYESIRLLSSCTSELPKHFASAIVADSQKKSGSFRQSAVDVQKQSVGTKFKAQLFKLMQQLENTTPHFIRCIKPNSKQHPGIFEYDLVLQQLRCCGILEVVRISRLGYPTRMTHQQFAERYGFLLLDTLSSQDPLTISVAVLQQFNIPPEMYQVGYTKLFFRTGQVAALENVRSRMLRGALWIQRCFRGLRVRYDYHGLKKGAMTLQSFVRGEKERIRFGYLVKRWRAAVLIQKYVRRLIAMTMFSDWHKDVILLQSVIRGCLARNKFKHLQEERMTRLSHNKINKGARKDISKTKEMNGEHPHPSVAELQRRALNAESVLQDKEEENVILKQQLEQYEKKWTEYEAKMKTMEETWKKQLSSLQVSLATAKRSLAFDDVACPPARIDASSTDAQYDTEDTMSTGTRTPEVADVKHQNHTSEDRLAAGNVDRRLNAVNHLAMEFEDRRHVFEDDAGFLVAVKSGQAGSNMNPDEELRKLKDRFATWKKDYKARLRETKVALQKVGNHDEKSRKRWWGKRSSK